MGVMSLFGELEDGPAFDDRIRIPDLEFDKKQRLAFEKEMLGSLRVRPSAARGRGRAPAQGRLHPRRARRRRRRRPAHHRRRHHRPPAEVDEEGRPDGGLPARGPPGHDRGDGVPEDDGGGGPPAGRRRRWSSCRAAVDKREDTPKFIPREVQLFEPMADSTPPLRLNLSTGRLSDEMVQRAEGAVPRFPRRLRGSHPARPAAGSPPARPVPGQHPERARRRVAGTPRGRRRGELTSPTCEVKHPVEHDASRRTIRRTRRRSCREGRHDAAAGAGDSETSETKSRRPRVALFRRFPALVGRPPVAPFDVASDTLLDVTDKSRPLTLEAAAVRYRHLAPALRELQSVVVPLYDECNTEALLEQNRHRRQQVLLLIGALLTTSFGSVQAAPPDRCGPGSWLPSSRRPRRRCRASAGGRPRWIGTSTSDAARETTQIALLPSPRRVDRRRRAPGLRAALQEQAVALRYDKGPAM